MTHHVDLTTLVLEHGGHDNRADGMCLLEAVAWFAGEEHSDEPDCVSPVLRAYGVALNDALNEGRRQELKPLIPLLVGTAGDGLDAARSYLALDWLIRTWAPAWLDLAKLTGEAADLRALPRIIDPAAVATARPVLESARKKAAAARAAAWDAAGAAARAAAGDAARAAAWDAAGAAAWAAAWDAARAAAWDAARAAAWDAARAAAWA